MNELNSITQNSNKIEIVTALYTKQMEQMEKGERKQGKRIIFN